MRDPRPKIMAPSRRKKLAWDSVWSKVEGSLTVYSRRQSSARQDPEYMYSSSCVACHHNWRYYPLYLQLLLMHSVLPHW